MTVKKTQVLEEVHPHNIPYQTLIDQGKPVILKGVASHWELVKEGLKSDDRAMQYLLRYYNAKKMLCYQGSPEIQGRFFYNKDITGINFQTVWTTLDAFLQNVAAASKSVTPESFYIGSTTLDACLPGMREHNDLMLSDEMFQNYPPIVSIWLGNRTTASTHYDFSNNIACCLVGKRRFTLFPPDQIENLYPGPLEPTPGGQVVSMVDVNNPDFERFPRFSEALSNAEVADLEPGDVLFYPSMWWHNVESLDSFNVMVNYWWNLAPRFLDSPQTTLLHALLSLRDRPEQEKRAWKAVLDYYIFGDAQRTRDHLPDHAQGNLAPLDELKARRLRAELLQRLNR